MILNVYRRLSVGAFQSVKMICASLYYHNDPYFSYRQFWTHSVDPDQTIHGLHSLLLRLHLLDTLFYGKAIEKKTELHLKVVMTFSG